MPQIELSEVTYRRLQARGIACVDSPESVIVRLLDQTQGHLISPDCLEPAAGAEAAALAGLRVLDADRVGDLTHTKVLAAKFGSRHATKWNELLIAAHAEALRRLGSVDRLQQATISAIVKGSRSDSGFHYQPELGISMQYVDSNNAWRQILHLAKTLGEPVEVKFLWRTKEGAAYPGDTGVINWRPATNRQSA